MAGGRWNLWITYAWQNNESGDFDFLLGRLKGIGIDTIFDKVAIVPGRRLWEQISARIEDRGIHGWAILITEESLRSEACKEELAYALDRALREKGGAFPLLGLVHGVPIDQVPAPLRVRLLIDLRDPNWPESVLAGLEGRPPTRTLPASTTYRWELISDFRGPGTLAVVVRPRLGERRYWRFLYPEGANRIDWGYGPPQKAGYTGALHTTVDGGRGALTGALHGKRVEWVGAGDLLTPGTGCYIVFGPPLPEFIGFATATEPFGPPAMDTFEYAALK